MQIPNAERAVIASEKFTDYLLSPSHPIGRFKSVFFRRLGYEAEYASQLETDIRRMLASDAIVVGDTEFGTKFSITATITGPNGESAKLVSVWIILWGEDRPRFITAYPGER